MSYEDSGPYVVQDSDMFNPNNCTNIDCSGGTCTSCDAIGCVSCDFAHIKKMDQCYPSDIFLNKNRQFSQYARKFSCLDVFPNKAPNIVSTPFSLNSYPLLGLPGTPAEQKAEYKQKVVNHGPNYIGMSKKMQYGKYAQTTPGLTTFANKKYTALQPLVAQKQECFTILCSKF
jgi:hypothetical protein